MPVPRERSFAASYDSTTKIVSTAIGVVLLIPPVATHSAMVGLLSGLVLLIAYAYSPRRYELADRSVLIHRLAGKVRISLDDIREARPAQSSDFDGCIRLLGNGGLFGYYGLFRTYNLGKCSWYLTNRERVVVLITARKTALFSPDDPDGMVEAIRATAPTPSAISFAKVRPSPPSGMVAKFFTFAVVLAALAFGAFAMLYSLGPPGYTLTSTSLAIHDRFYPVSLSAASVDVAHIRVVDIGSDTDWRPAARTKGFANSRYRSGWFRVGNGQEVRMYRAGAKRLVLLPPKGNSAPVLLEVAQPEDFMAAIRQAWTRP